MLKPIIISYKLTTCQLLYLTTTYKPREILLTIISSQNQSFFLEEDCNHAPPHPVVIQPSQINFFGRLHSLCMDQCQWWDLLVERGAGQEKRFYKCRWSYTGLWSHRFQRWGQWRNQWSKKGLSQRCNIFINRRK